MASGGYNPFFRQVDGSVSAELSRRSRGYGARTRTGNAQSPPGQPAPASVNFAYRKVAWATVTGAGIVIGTNSVPLMTNSTGQLTLYSSTRNLPNIPLLQSVEISNEGMLGSLVKGSATFTLWPELDGVGFGGNFQKILDGLLSPGQEVTIRWGWSVDGGGVNSGAMNGIINNFEWSVNGDLSVTCKLSAIGKGGTSMGVSGEISNPDQAGSAQVTDPQGNVIPNTDLINIIKQDIATIQNSTPPVTTLGPAVFVGNGNNNGFGYVAVPLPRGEEDASGTTTSGTAGVPTGPRPVDCVYYVSLGNLVDVMNTKINNAGVLGNLFEIHVRDNATQYYQEVRSAVPEEVMFPDPTSGGMASYGQVDPFVGLPIGTNFYPARAGGPKCNLSSCVNIGDVLLSTSFISRLYKKFVQENQTNIEQKNVSKFFDEIAKGINYASGEMYQISCNTIERPSGTGQAELSIEDMSLGVCNTCITAQQIDASTKSPLIKSVQISSKPPGPAATAAYLAARPAGGNAPSLDVRNDRNPNATDLSEAQKTVTDLRNNFVNVGYGASFTKDMRAALTKYKRSYGAGHWTNYAIYPIDLSVTIDGITGFKFGDVVTTNLIPRTAAVKMVFTVVKITHSIKDGVWETTLHTKARMKP